MVDRNRRHYMTDKIDRTMTDRNDRKMTDENVRKDDGEE